jgi:hypothetical protein
MDKLNEIKEQSVNRDQNTLPPDSRGNFLEDSKLSFEFSNFCGPSRPVPNHPYKFISVGGFPQGSLDVKESPARAKISSSSNNASHFSDNDDSYDYDIELSEGSKRKPEESKHLKDRDPEHLNLMKNHPPHQTQSLDENHISKESNGVKPEMVASSVLKTDNKTPEVDLKAKPTTFKELIQSVNPSLSDKNDICAL